MKPKLQFTSSTAGSARLPWPVAAVFLFVCFLFLQPHGVMALGTNAGFDHFSTGFPLEGAHQNAPCSSCHLHGLFQGTPVACAACHNQASLMAADKMPSDHIQTNLVCEDCHTDAYWKPLANMNHDAVIGSCATCHDGSTSTGKTVNHISSANTCEDCHTTTAWATVTFDHSNVTGTCSSCHDGATATGKHINHIPSADTCEDCHTTSAWTRVSFDHTNVTGACSSCHDGIMATGRRRNHIQTSTVCEACHLTTAWLPVIQVDHAEVQGTCASCHDGCNGHRQECEPHPQCRHLR